MRYTAKWSNGAWKLFDSHEYDDIEIFDRQVDAEDAAAYMNARVTLRKAARR